MGTKNLKCFLVTIVEKGKCREVSRELVECVEKGVELLRAYRWLEPDCKVLVQRIKKLGFPSPCRDSVGADEAAVYAAQTHAYILEQGDFWSDGMMKLK